MILQGFWKSSHHLPWYTLGIGTLQCQQQKFSPIEVKTHNLKWYLSLKFDVLELLLSYIHNSFLTSFFVAFWWANLYVLQTWVSNRMLFQDFDCKLTYKVLFLYILPFHHFNLRVQPWRYIYFGAELIFLAGSYLQKYLRS